MRIKDVALWPFDQLYEWVCWGLDCTYCAFYRGVLFGAVVGAAISGVCTYALT
jgi:hypothetical protein